MGRGDAPMRTVRKTLENKVAKMNVVKRVEVGSVCGI